MGHYYSEMVTNFTPEENIKLEAKNKKWKEEHFITEWEDEENTKLNYTQLTLIKAIQKLIIPRGVDKIITYISKKGKVLIEFIPKKQ